MNGIDLTMGASVKEILQERIPAKVRVGGHNVDIVWVDDLSDGDDGSTTCGEYHCHPKYEICVLHDANVSNIVDTLFHEISHAIWDIYGIEEGNNEEQVVSILASAWTQIMRDNPRLFLGLVELMIDYVID